MSLGNDTPRAVKRCKGKQAKLATSYFQPINPLLQAYGLTLTVNP